MDFLLCLFALLLFWSVAFGAVVIFVLISCTLIGFCWVFSVECAFFLALSLSVLVGDNTNKDIPPTMLESTAKNVNMLAPNSGSETGRQAKKKKETAKISHETRWFTFFFLLFARRCTSAHSR